MSRLVWFYICGICLIAGGLTLTLTVNSPVAVDPLVFLVFILLSIVGQFLEVNHGRNSYYVHLVPFFAAVVLLTPLGFTVVVTVPHLVEWLKRRLEGNPFAWYIQPYNIATHLIAGLMAQSVFVYLGGSFTAFSLQTTLLATIPALLVYLFINHYLIGQVLFLARGIPWSDSRVLAFEPLLSDGAMLSLGYMAALLWALTPWLMLLVLGPFVLFYQALQVPNLKKKSQMDTKTGLWNARYFEERFSQELADVKRLNRPLSIIMVDLDLLRNINNTYGHVAGDVVIAGVGDIIMQTIGKENIACRFGGEEYAIVLPHVDQTTAADYVAERIRQGVERSPFHVTTSTTPLHATVSLGVASFPGDGQSVTDLIHEADIALYQAKIQGRNRVVATAAVPHSASLSVDNPHTARQERERANQASYPLAAERLQEPESLEPDVLPEPAAALSDPAAVGGKPMHGAARSTAQNNPPRHLLLRLLVGTVIAAGFLFMLCTLLYNHNVRPVPLIVFTVLALGAQWLQVEMYEKSTVSTSMTVIVAAAVVSGPLGLLVASTAVVIVHALRARPHVYKILFNWSAHLLAGLGFLALVYLPSHYLSVPLTGNYILWWIALTLCATLFYYVVETYLVAAAIGLDGGVPIGSIWQGQFRWLARYYLAMGMMGFFLSVAYLYMDVVGVLVFSLPMIIMHLSQKEYVMRTDKSMRELRRMNSELSQANNEIVHAKDAIEQLNEELFLTLAKIIDTQDPYVSGHATQVGEYARAIAEEMNLSAQKVEQAYRAGLLHDIGKIGVPEKLLHKPTRLTDAEYEIVKRHAAIGADFLATCQDLRHLSPFVRHHHEHWDGSGYPDGLQGQAIPLESRILAVCDSLEAMASDRPYHTGQPLENIVQELERHAGTQFDPTVVDAFIRVAKRHPKLVINSAIAVANHQSAPQSRYSVGKSLVDQRQPDWAY